MPLIVSNVESPPPPVEPPIIPGEDGTGGGGAGPGAVTWGALEVGWTGWDGSVWVLSSPDSPVWLTPGGTRGLSMPPIERFTSVSPAVGGSRWRGYRVQERPVFWPLFLYGGSTAEWRAVDRAFWATMRPDAVGTWTVAQPDGTRRHLTCRFDSDSDHAFTVDPFSTGWVLYALDMVAEDPFWRGEPVRREFTAAGSPVPFYGGTGGTGFGPPFHISSNTSTATATMPNDGDEPAWPRYRLNGPFSSASVGVAGQLVTVPFGYPAGKWLEIDTRPDRMLAFDSDGVDRVGDLGAVAFAPIPRGAAVPITITVPGSDSATRVEVTIEPQYHRAW